MTQEWPDWDKGQVVRGTGGGMTGKVGTVISDVTESGFGHKWVEVKWDADGKVQTVRTSLLEAYSPDAVE